MKSRVDRVYSYYLVAAYALDRWIDANGFVGVCIFVQHCASLLADLDTVNMLGRSERETGRES